MQWKATVLHGQHAMHTHSMFPSISDTWNMQFDGAIIKFSYTISVGILSALKLAAWDFGMVFNILNRSSAIISRGEALNRNVIAIDTHRLQPINCRITCKMNSNSHVSVLIRKCYILYSVGPNNWKYILYRLTYRTADYEPILISLYMAFVIIGVI